MPKNPTPKRDPISEQSARHRRNQAILANTVAAVNVATAEPIATNPANNRAKLMNP